MEIKEICNIWKLKCTLELKKGEMICPICKGHGGIFDGVSFKQKYFTVSSCLLCEGNGKIDWIKAITKEADSNIGQTKYISFRCGGQHKCSNRLAYLYRQQAKELSINPWKNILGAIRFRRG